MWQDFTNLYSVSKTLRFELIPTEQTETQLRNSGVIEIDKNRHESFKQAKKVLDEIHRKFIADSLDGLRLDTSEVQAFAELSLDRSPRKDKARQTELTKLQKSLYATFGDRFVATQKYWADKYDCAKFITSPESQLALIETFKPVLSQKLEMTEQELSELSRQFDKFASYFQGYKENRENIYSIKGSVTEIAHRCVDQNLLKFYKNLQKYQKFYEGKDILPKESEQYFTIDNYSDYITQDDINSYNETIGGLRFVINQARQGLSKQDKKAFPMFEPLFKQILGDGTKKVLFEKLENEEEYSQLVEKLQQDLPIHIADVDNHAKKYLGTPSNPESIWLNARAANTLIHKNITSVELVKDYLPKEFTVKKRARDDETAKQSSFISVQQLFDAIDQAQTDAKLSILKDNGEKTSKTSMAIWNNFYNDLQIKLGEAKRAIDSFAKSNKTEKETIKKALDSFNDVYRMYSYFELRYKNEPITSLGIDPDFYELFEDPDDQDSLFDTDKNKRFPHYYDLIRNYLTKKPYSLDKWKLNFDCSQLLSGWDVNKEPEKHGVILKNSEGYHLAIISNAASKIFDRYKNKQLFQTDEGSDWQKMDYKLLPGPNKMLPKCLLPKSDRYKYGATDEILDIYETGSFKKGDNFELNKLHKMIDFYKQAIKRYEGWSMYDFAFKETAQYQGIDEFYHAVESQGYKLDFVPINAGELQKMVDEGKIYLFRIQNKDLANPNTKTPNMHTFYFRSLFEKDSTIKLNGEAELFFRPETKSLPKSNTDRKTPQGTKVIELKRFRSDKMQLHLPINLNYQTKSLVNATFNQHAIERIKTNGINAVIGIDRGEKHLAYVAVVDKNGKLLDEPISLNNITSNLPDGGKKLTPYFDLLAGREKERKENRQNWEVVRQIRDLKSGYIGHCVKQIVDLMIKHNAIVVMENLNVGFKQGRSAIEKSVYNQLEQALLHKLQYVVDKNKPAQVLFGPQNGVQLTPPSVTPKDTYNQMGFIFFVDPSYTSAVDPKTGYRQHFRLDDRINVGTFNNFIQDGFKDIKYKDGNLLFEFSWRQLAIARNKIKKDTRSEKESEISNKPWVVTANVERLVYNKTADGGHGTTIRVYPQSEFLKLFENEKFDMHKNIKKQLLDHRPSAKFVGSFIYLFNTVNKLRNSDTSSHIDAIASPVYRDGFDSTKDKLNGYKWNGDANGAYNIARKGAILLDKLYSAETPKDFKATVTREEYDKFITP